MQWCLSSFDHTLDVGVKVNRSFGSIDTVFHCGMMQALSIISISDVDFHTGIHRY